MAGAGGTRVGRLAQLAAPAGAVTVATLENVLLAFEPRVVMAAMHTTMMSASMTAYSTAVGPSSFLRNATSFLVRRVTGSLTGGDASPDAGVGSQPMGVGRTARRGGRPDGPPAR